MILIALAMLSGPCGLERVEAAPEGAYLTFAHARTAHLQAGTEAPRKVAIGPEPLLLRPGEMLEFHNDNDGCSFALAVKDGQTGVEQISWVAPAGQMPFRQMTFVPFQRR
jgi:hypothetical protein